TPFDERTAPLSDQRSGIRFPDALEVTETGELVAIEVEVSGKAEDRLRMYVEGYKWSLPQVQNIRQPDGSMRAGLVRRQFRQVQWHVTPDAGYMLRGHHDFKTGQPVPGMVQELMPHAFPTDYDWANQAKGRPMQVLDATSVDEGLQYALEQRVLDPQYRCDYGVWKRWRRFWQDDVAPEHRAVFTFPRWIRTGTNHASCMARIRR